MEDHTTTDATIDVFLDLVQWYADSLGICVQANLRRTAEDLNRLVETDGSIRLVKGAYSEPAEIAFTTKKDIDEAYAEHLRFLFSNHDGGIAVASHDDLLVSQAAVLHIMHDVEYEVQMLMGVNETAQRELARDQRVVQYIPYGPSWKSYVYRRLLERKNLGFILKAVFHR
jgi:proline dehydrogenase